MRILRPKRLLRRSKRTAAFLLSLILVMTLLTQLSPVNAEERAAKSETESEMLSQENDTDGIGENVPDGVDADTFEPGDTAAGKIGGNPHLALGAGKNNAPETRPAVPAEAVSVMGAPTEAVIWSGTGDLTIDSAAFYAGIDRTSLEALTGEAWDEENARLNQEALTALLLEDVRATDAGGNDLPVYLVDDIDVSAVLSPENASPGGAVVTYGARLAVPITEDETEATTEEAASEDAGETETGEAAETPPVEETEYTKDRRVFALPAATTASDAADAATFDAAFQDAVAAGGGEINITGSFQLLKAYEIPAGVELTLTASGGKHTVTAVTGGRHFFVAGGVFVLDADILLTGASAPGGHNSGSSILVTNRGDFTMKQGEISGNTSGAINQNGGYDGIVGISQSTFTMTGGSISDNTIIKYDNRPDAIDAALIVSGSVITITGGVISNTIGGNGIHTSGIHSDMPALNIEGGTFSGNESAGIYIGAGAFEMSGGVVSENHHSGVYISGGSGSIPVISGGLITNNVAPSKTTYGIPTGCGGGVAAAGSAILILEGDVKITNNTATDAGGGVFATGPLTINGTGVEITGNTASLYGGGICMYVSSSTLNDPYYYIKYLKLSAGAAVTFSGNHADSSIPYPDRDGVSTHATNILGTYVTSDSPETGEPFEFLYNNYDVGYTKAGTPPAPPSYTVTYHLGAAPTTITPPPPVTFVAGSGEKVTDEIPLWPGHRFVEWSTYRFLPNANSVSYQPGEPLPESTMTLYAQWETEQSYTVSYNLNGAPGTEPASQTFTASDHATVTDEKPQWKGHIFVGWNTKPDGSGAAYDAGSPLPPENMALYAMWTEDSYTVTFHFEDGVTADLAVSGVKGQTELRELIAEYSMDSLDWDGHMFGGWALNETGSIPVAEGAIVDADLDLYARWTLGRFGYTVRYFVTGTATKLADDKIVAGNTFGTIISENALPFAKHTPDAATKSLTIGSDEARNVIDFYYTPDPAPLYTVRFLPGAHGAFSLRTYTVKADSATPSAPRTPGTGRWEFTRWSPAVASTVTETVDYVAQWRLEPNTRPDAPDPTAPTGTGPTIPPPTNPTGEPTEPEGSEPTGGVIPGVIGPTDGTGGSEAPGPGEPSPTPLPEPDQAGLEPNAPAESSPADVSQDTTDILDGSVPLANIPDNEVPLVPPADTGAWALLNLLFAIVGALFAVGAGVRALLRKKREHKQEDIEAREDIGSRRFHPAWLAVGGVLGIAGVILFLLTQDMNLTMVLLDNLSLVHGLLLAAEIAAVALTFKKFKKDEQDVSER